MLHPSQKALITALIAAVSAPTLASQKFPSSYDSLGIEVSYVDSGNSEDKSDAKDDLHNYGEVGANYTHQFNPTTSLFIQGSMAQPETRNTDRDADLYRGSVGGRIHPSLYRLGGWRPFAGAGYSHTYIDADGFDSENEHMLYAEAGLQSMLAPRILAEAGIRGRVELEDTYTDGQVFASLNYVFGRQYPAAPKSREPLDLSKLSAPPVDSDGDGVPDSRDKCPDTPEGALVEKDGCAKELTREIKETLYVEFEHDKTEVLPSFYPQIKSLAKTLREYPTSRILLEGHTDSTGPSSYNQKLSKSRAGAVMKVLIDEFGISPDRIRTTGMGESQPVATNDTENGRAQNRRVEAIVSGEYSEIVKKDQSATP